MNNLGSQFSAALDRLAGVYQPLFDRFSATGSVGLSRQTTLIVAAAVLGLLVVGLIAAIALMPAKRKTVRKRRMRRTMRAMPATANVAAATGVSAVPGDGGVARRARRRRTEGLVITTVLAVTVVATFVATYMFTGSNEYCGQSCHVGNATVVVAVRNPHGKCIDCHESDPVSGMASRIRMAAYSGRSDRIATSIPVDPARCLNCHRTITATTVTTAGGVKVSHKEIVAGGYACTDCHPDEGHRKGRSYASGMTPCMRCHDGKHASKACSTCHVSGSPIAVASAATKARSAFGYGVVRAANEQCQKCHGAEKECIACHGLVLPHSEAFIQGGHARQSAFEGKEVCFKCHALGWCSAKCHGEFAHSPTWKKDHQTGTSERCGSCHPSWNQPQNDPNANFCKVCH